jgi:hypothetical protein
MWLEELQVAFTSTQKGRGKRKEKKGCTIAAFITTRCHLSATVSVLL